MDAVEQVKQYILVVDSDEEDLFHTCILLRRFGHEIVTARSGEKALEFMVVSPPAAVVADPSEDVVDFISRLRQDPRFFDIPLVLLSWWPNALQEEGKIKGEYFSYIRKPVDVVQLYQTVEAAVERGPRRNIRIMTQLLVTLEDGLDNGDGLATTLSEYGMFFRTVAPRHVGALIPAILMIQDAQIRLEAEVLYVIPFKEGPFQEPGMGLKFVNINRPDRELIMAFIIEQLKNGSRGS